MTKVVFLLEEASMEHLLRGLLPRLLPRTVEGRDWQLIPHSGKSDLERSIPRKLKAWREPGVRFCIIRDQDSGDCRAIKADLVKLARDVGKSRQTRVRIACRELEAWYFGDPEALADAYQNPALRNLSGRKDYRQVDAIVSPSRRLERLVPEFGKTDAARRMGTRLRLEPNVNTSRSFQVTLDAIRALAA